MSSSASSSRARNDLILALLDLNHLGCTPRLVAGDAGFYSAANERGVKRVCVPNRSTKSAERKREQKKRWFKQGQK